MTSAPMTDVSPPWRRGLDAEPTKMEHAERAETELSLAETEFENLCEKIGPATHEEDVKDFLFIWCNLEAGFDRMAAIRKAIKADVEKAMLAWFHNNEKVLGSVEVGDLTFFPTRRKTLSVKDPEAALVEVLTEILIETMRSDDAIYLAGDQRNRREMARNTAKDIAGLLAPYTTKNGLKPAACRNLLGREVFDKCWETRYPDRLESTGNVPKKLGVAVTRFLEQKTGF